MHCNPTDSSPAAHRRPWPRAPRWHRSPLRHSPLFSGQTRSPKTCRKKFPQTPPSSPTPHCGAPATSSSRQTASGRLPPTHRKSPPKNPSPPAPHSAPQPRATPLSVCNPARSARPGTASHSPRPVRPRRVSPRTHSSWHSPHRAPCGDLCGIRPNFLPRRRSAQ